MPNPKDIEVGKKLLSLGFIKAQELSSFITLLEERKKTNPHLSLLEIIQEEKKISPDQSALIQKECGLETTKHKKLEHQEVENRQSLQKQEQCIGHYKILDELGHGGMGRVYKVLDTKLERTLALKILATVDNESSAKRFQREAKAMARLHHPNIVNIYETGESQGVIFYTMDFIDGVALNKILEAQSLSLKQLLHIMVKICNGIHYAHTQGVVHRDLKPANIMIDKNNEPQIMDFGLAKVSGTNTKLSQSGVAMGTLHYMPPEQADGRTREIDAQSDVYALGVMLYEIMTGRLPFAGNTFFQIMSQIMNKEPTAPTKIKKTLSKSLERICLKAMAKNKQDRYSSALELGEDISRFLDGKKVTVKKKRIFQKKPAQKIAGCIVGLILLFALAGIWMKTAPRETKLPPISLSSAKENKKPLPVKTDENTTLAQTKKIPDKPSPNAPVNPNPGRFPDKTVLPLLYSPEMVGKISSIELMIGKEKKGTKDAEKLNAMHIQMADIYHESGQLQREVESLQNITLKSSRILWRLACCSIEGEMFIHARYYLKEIQTRFPHDSLAAEAEEKIRKIDERLKISPAFSKERKAVWLIMRQIAYARLARLEKQSDASANYLGKALQEARQAELTDFLPYLLSLMALADIYEQNFDKARTKLLEIENFSSVRPSYSLLSCIFKPNNSNVIWPEPMSINNSNVIWPEVIFAKAMYHFFQGQYEEANRFLSQMEKEYGRYPSDEGYFLRLHREYAGFQPNLRNIELEKWRETLSNDINKVIFILAMRGLMNGKAIANNRQKNLELLEDIYNLEIECYMIHSHIGFIFITMREYEKAIRHLSLSCRLVLDSINVYGLSELAIAYGNKAEAIRYLEYCYMYPCLGTTKEDIKARLEKLKN